MNFLMRGVRSNSSNPAHGGSHLTFGHYGFSRNFGAFQHNQRNMSVAVLAGNVRYTLLNEANSFWMIGMNAVENHGESNLKRLSYWISLRFVRHEAWTLKAARRAPIFSLFAVMTLSVWFFVPMIPIGILYVFLLEKAGIWGAIVNMVLGIGGLATIIPWLFRWYFICAGLMIGCTKLAQSKANEISGRLKRLSGLKSASERT